MIVHEIGFETLGQSITGSFGVICILIQIQEYYFFLRMFEICEIALLPLFARF